MSKVIGLTGGIATGKSTVAKMFRSVGIPVIDTDAITHSLYTKESEVYDELVQTFGQRIVLENNDINRKVLGQLIYNDRERRCTLNRIVHPNVKKIALREIEKYKKLNHKVIVVDVPLLFETDFIDLVDISLVVYTWPDLQHQRLMARDGINPSFAWSKINSQMPLLEKVFKADYTIDNSHSISETRDQFNKFLEEIGVS